MRQRTSEKDKALDKLEKAYEDREGFIPLINVDFPGRGIHETRSGTAPHRGRSMALLHNDSRNKDLLKRIGLNPLAILFILA